MSQLMEVDTDFVGIKSKSKAEMYSLLSSVGKIYLPQIRDYNHKFIYQL